MKVITGLKGIFKQPIYLFALISFILIWSLILANTFLRNFWIGLSIFIIGGGLLFFILVLFIISFFKPLSMFKPYFFIIILTIGIILAFFLLDSVYFPTSDIFFMVPLIANQIFTAFFAFKLCMDSTTKLDDFFYKKEKYRVITRSIEFFLFGFLVWGIMRITIGFFSRTPTELFRVVIQIIEIMFWIYLVLMCVVVLRLLIKRKFTAYITLFFLLTFCYVLYILLDSIFGAFYSTESGDLTYIIISFIGDILIFLYMIGTVYARVDYIQNKLKVLKVDTIALFLILMRIYVQISKIVPRTILPELQILQAGGLFIIFIFCTLLFGIHSIFSHKPNIEKKDK
ncbi:MAG: hypothetical protein ACFFKA_07525 [Candidatus Thorarchaeota archaeon]